MDEALLRLLQAVKQDDVRLFAQLTDQKKAYLSVSFGRFPILSLCYLYKSTGILRAYEKILSGITQYTVAEEDFLSYKKFRSLAGKCMRLYRGGRFVYPLEMLAVLNDGYYLNRVYPHFYKPAGTAEHIQKIYAILRGKSAKADEKSVLLPRSRLRPRQKLLVGAVLTLAAILLFVSVYAMGNIRLLTGEGTEENPYRISGETQLIKALSEESAYCVLTRDVTLTKDWTAVDFRGTLDGGGHTVYAGGYTKNGFFRAQSGTLNNIRFDFTATGAVTEPLLAAQNSGTLSGLTANFTGEGPITFVTALLLVQNTGTLSDITLDIRCDAEITADSALFLSQNQGTLTGVNAAVRGNFTEESANQVLYFSSLVYQNTGTFTDGRLYCETTYAGNADGDAFYAGFVAINSGTLERCETLEGSYLRTDTVDVAGIATVNQAEATLTACVNRAEITQTTAMDQWSPNVAGIVTSNYGPVTDSVNAGALRAEQNAPAGDYSLIAFAGGICAENLQTLTGCRNTGSVTVKAEHYEIYAGGIAGINRATVSKTKNDAAIYGYSGDHNVFVGGIAGYNTSYAVLTESGSFGRITIEYNKEAAANLQNLFAGGIVGGNYGRMASCFAGNTYAYTHNDVGTLRVGGLAGLNYGEYSILANRVYLDVENNFYLTQPNVAFGIASIYYRITQYVLGDGNNVGTTVVFTPEELRASEVYWE